MKSTWKAEIFKETYYFNNADIFPDRELIRVQAFCHSLLYPGNNIPHIPRPVTMISMIIGGSDAYTSEETGPLYLPYGTFFIRDLNVPLNDFHRNNQVLLERYFILLENTPLLKTILKQLFPLFDGDLILQPQHPGRIQHCFENVRKFMRKRQQNDAVLSGLCLQLLLEAAWQQPQHNRQPEALAAARLYVENHFHESSLHREQIAMAAGVSIATLQRLFKKYLQTSVGGYITERRLQQGEHYLSETTNTVAQIAEKCGYRYSYHFAREFKRKRGLTPLEYRNKMHGKITFQA